MIEHKGDKIRVMAYMPLHYGSEYFTEACRSVLPAVDELVILYSSTPTFGHSSDIPLPPEESEKELYKLFEKLRDYPEASGKRLKWLKVPSVTRENNHRETGNRYAKSKHYHLAVALDSDEIWDTNSLLDCLVEAFNSSHHQYKTNHEGWFHFYRSFKNYCSDGFQPVRIFNFNNYNITEGIVKSNRIYHMGYAINKDLMRYKLGCHGHKSEIDINKFFAIWSGFEKNDWNKYQNSKGFIQDTSHTLHPASKQVWQQTKQFLKRDLPELLKNHKHADKGSI